MGDKKTSTKAIQRDLDLLTREGIRADSARLKRDMCTQFSDPREWIREYVTNAQDAGARRVRVSGRETGKHLLIVVEDDGHGMNRDGVLGFLTVYRSSKRSDEPIGHHGIGKLSVAAIPGQSEFLMRTSTGSECWQVRAGSLLADEPIHVESVTPVPPRGTRFEITFEKQESLATELARLRAILLRYTAFLSTDIVVDECADGKTRPGVPLNLDWRTTAGRRGRSYVTELAGQRAEITIGFASGGHELYQSRVYVTSRYHLTAKGFPAALDLPGLLIRVDSRAFDLPFGRHCLRNEDVLGPLAMQLRERVLPDYVGALIDEYEHGCLVEVSAAEVEALCAGLLDQGTPLEWRLASLPLFMAVNGERPSLAELDVLADERGCIYREADDSAGLDYGVFGVPVLTRVQPSGCNEILTRRFDKRMVTLGVEDLVLEPPVNGALGEREQRFMDHLRFHPEALGRALRPTPRQLQDMAQRQRRWAGADPVVVKVGEEAEQAQSDLAAITWKVNYLVGSDGRSPCRTHRFLLRGDSVVLNLNHPEIARLFALADQHPTLAGHWGLAIALTDPSQRILPHLSHAAREDLLIADAVAKCTGADLADESDADALAGIQTRRRIPSAAN
jgi:hypothetical protein